MNPILTNLQDFFNQHAADYDSNEFTHNTLAEIDFILEHLKIAPASRILDVGCGTGRHSVQLAKHGFTITGIDLSEGMLAIARQRAQDNHASVEFIRADATRWSGDENYDVALCLCEGAFSLLNPSDDPFDHDRQILTNIYHSLKPGGSFLLTCLNALAKIRQCSPDDIAAGRFDPNSMVEISDLELPNQHKVVIREKAYTPIEIQRLLEDVGFSINHVGGGTAGNWGLRPVDPDEIELMVIAQKPTRLSRITLSPIGFISSPVTGRTDEDWGQIISEIQLKPEFTAGLQGLSGFSHALIMYHLHQSNYIPENHLQRRPRGREDLPRCGIFSQRAKNRPNALGLTAVKIIAINDGILKVQGLDAIDGTPVLDIKPYIPHFDRIDNSAHPAWVDEIMQSYF